MIVHLALYQILGLLLVAYGLGMLTLYGLAVAASRGDRERAAAWRRHLAEIDRVGANSDAHVRTGGRR